MHTAELFRLEGKVALITGGSRGLGLQIAEALADMGAQLALVSRKQADLEAAANHLRGRGAAVMTVAADLAAETASTEVLEQVMATYDQVDILVNNAGATWGAAAEDYPPHAWHKVISLNLTAAFLLSQQVARASMIPRQQGSIINIASVAGLQANHPQMMGTVAYNSSKAGLINMTRALASEWAKYKIRVNAIAPGFFPTKMTAGTLQSAEAAITATTPLQRLGTEHDLKGTGVLLASEASAFITGQVIAVDGGISII